MTLILRIENFDQLENGGPTWLQLDGQGASVGRRASMDWTLPDPTKMISGHHFDITFRDGQYFLTDVSMNGTFLDGQRHRLEGPVLLRGGERLIVGHYIIAVELQQQQAQAGAPGAAADDPWGAYASPSDPVRTTPQQGNAPGGSLDDLAGGFVPVQRPSFSGGLKTETSLQMPIYRQPGAPHLHPEAGRIQRPGDWSQPQPPFPGPGRSPGLSQPPMATPPGPEPVPQPPSADTPPPYTPSFLRDEEPAAEEPPAPEAPAAPEPTPEPYTPTLGEPAATPESEPPASIPRPRPTPEPPQASSPAPEPEPPQAPAPEPVQGHGDVTALLRAFCEGAGLEPDAVRPEAAIGLMHMLGRCTRIATEEMMLMLKSRADVKHFTRGGVRTMLSANANNPMKFMPDSQQALELMFVSPRDGFMTGADSFDDALKDIRIHQEAVFRALQPALAEAFAGLSPEEIEQACETTGGNLLSGMVGGHAGAKQWATYVERWDDKAQAGENGVLDAFLQAFAKAYAEASKRG